MVICVKVNLVGLISSVSYPPESWERQVGGDEGANIVKDVKVWRIRERFSELKKDMIIMILVIWKGDEEQRDLEGRIVSNSFGNALSKVLPCRFNRRIVEVSNS